MSRAPNVAMFYHSLRSDWNHGNAHFLRGVATELVERGANVTVYEPSDAWSVQNLVREHGTGPLEEFREVYPKLRATVYDRDAFDLDAALANADLVLVHEWNDHDLVARIGRHRADSGHYRLLFHDTHHRSVTEPDAMRAYDLRSYDGALVFGEVLRDIYRRDGLVQRTWTWHEAADTRVFRPLEAEPAGDLVWVGNWGDDERTTELHEFLLEPVRDLALDATVHGVRYPDEARAALAAAGVRYGGWLPNYRAPQRFARHRVTVHVPRRPYTRALPGIPTIRPFEALACGIPLVSAPWDDSEGLFRPGRDYLVAHDGNEMRARLRDVLGDPDLAAELRASGLETIQSRHTCRHRVDELLEVARELGVDVEALARPGTTRKEEATA